MMNQGLKDELLANLIWTGTKQGAFQRSYIYNQEIKPLDSDKAILRQYIKEFCYKRLYCANRNKTISVRALKKLINKLIEEVDHNFETILNNGKFQFGNAQKFINLYLKLMWITGKAKEPPHFPVDSLIQNRLGTSETWTDMDEDEYMLVITAAKALAKKENLSLAKWEAKEYERITSNR